MPKLKAAERRNQIYEILSASKEPVKGSDLARQLGVSRQVIVTDIAMLRNRFPGILSTNSGYTLNGALAHTRVFKVNHDDDSTEDELSGIVDLGGVVVNVFVEHKVYGTITVPLDIRSKRDVANFIRDMKSGVSTPLKNITQGYHYHTVEARSEQILDEIEEMLDQRGYLIEAGLTPEVYSPKNYGV